MHRWPSVFVLLACWSAAEAAEHAPDPSSVERPNVLFLVCDDLNTRLAPYGYDAVPTPHLNRFTSSGVRFTRAYCQYPVCGPSRASFLSGLYPETTRVLGNKTLLTDARPGTVTLPELFRRAGYWTAATGKVFHQPPMDPPGAWDAAVRFSNDELPMVAAARERFVAEHGSITGKHRRPWLETVRSLGTQTSGRQSPGYGPSGLEDGGHMDGKNARQTNEWLTARAEDGRPFFIACGIHKPHVPFLAPQRYFDLYPQHELALAPRRPGDTDSVPRIALNNRFTAFGFPELTGQDPALQREYVQAYHACISFIDAQIGRVLSRLDELGLAEDTVVVFTSDHGYQLGEHGQWGKVTVFEACARVPLAVRVPGGPTGESDALVELVDLLPTLGDLCDVPVPDDVQGRSFAATLRNPAASHRDSAYTVVKRKGGLGRSIRTADWRYTRWPDGGEELYAHPLDADELHNLAADPDRVDVLADLRETLDRRAAAADR